MYKKDVKKKNHLQWIWINKKKLSGIVRDKNISFKAQCKNLENLQNGKTVIILQISILNLLKESIL